MSAYPANSYKDEPEDDLHFQEVDVHEVTLGPNGGGGVISSSTGKRSASTTNDSKKWYRKPAFVAGSACVCVVVAVVVLVIVALGGGGGGSSSSGSSEPIVGTNLPTPEVPLTELERNRNEFAQILLPLYTDRGMDTGPLSNPDSFQGRALDYVAGSELYKKIPPVKNVERYAAVVFYLSTFRQPHLLNEVLNPWTSKEHWVSNKELCLWEGIECNGDELVVGIILPENEMSGSLPLELSLLENLSKLDFTSNLLYMDEDNHGLWSLLPNLKELLMDDNYFISETGIPVQFGDLSSIQKISLSFNLLQGVFDEDVFAYMTNLVHFEAESNYIGGTLPESMLKLPDLTYIYLRRNSLEFALSDVLRYGNLPSLFALWLDGNTITGRIPIGIGNFTGIASFSVTNAELTGPIPTEMGLLTDLRRVWLYDNQLEGPIPAQAASAWINLEVFEVYDNYLIGVMPEAICRAINSSTYELKSLYADCDEIRCDCCTACN